MGYPLFNDVFKYFNDVFKYFNDVTLYLMIPLDLMMYLMMSLKITTDFSFPQWCVAWIFPSASGRLDQRPGGETSRWTWENIGT